MKRPTGFTVISLILGWFAIGAFANGAMQLNAEHGSKIMAILAFSYGVTALASTVGLWKFKKWAYHSFLVWSLIVVATMLNLQFGMYGMYRAPFIAFLGFSVFILALLTFAVLYIKKNLTNTTQTS
ncbi:hypothetical protein UWK_00463 [Desulfocapsa sulfexigens DSM 10523]|uniref:Uncharacterized protein n=1 Tax=Desulfocapsa sulfexigens (strain DSM 10523 / SB164P1) TaxID=1167006 RepID=M1PKP6_DESSD|nr:hypothetical protein [Desulfocapsa sulfexigens]AGF77046.1 hypothetical protein UWK_00463 [Desulfocapsa sulfexigens DSM 10523]